MPTRLYLNSFAIRPVPDRPAYDAAWDVTNTSRFGVLLPTLDPVTVAGSSSATAAVAGPANVQIWQGVSALLASDQTITGTVKGQSLMRESSVSANAMTQLVIRVLKPDGTIRGTLLAAHSLGALTQELSTSNRNAKIPYSGSASLTSLDCFTYDRILLEFGVRKYEVGSTSRTYFFRNGTSDATDLPEDETTTTNANAWIEFSQTLDLLELPNTGSMMMMGAGA